LQVTVEAPVRVRGLQYGVGITMKSTSHKMDPNPQQYKRVWKPVFPYAVDYNDHFETPTQAYRDIQPLILWMLKDQPVLYDPYFCNGATKVHLQELGFKNIIHEKRDFYRDIKNDTVPRHDMLITNPPYSEIHKVQCLNFSFERLQRDNTPFALLLPTYVATKAYFRECMDRHGLTNNSLLYIVPSVDYTYDHPEGTGKDVSPFRSMWFCGIPKERIGKISTFRQQRYTTSTSHPKLYLNVNELLTAKVVKLEHRPNPKQRRKKRKQLEHTLPAESPKSPPHEVSMSDITRQAKKGSKYRDVNGQRKRKRF
jgi:hypothetical protein